MEVSLGSRLEQRRGRIVLSVMCKNQAQLCPPFKMHSVAVMMLREMTCVHVYVSFHGLC